MAVCGFLVILLKHKNKYTKRGRIVELNNYEFLVLWLSKDQFPSMLVAPGSLVLINQKAICDAALNQRMSKIWKMMITWGKSMMITALLTVPPQEQHPSVFDSDREGAVI